MNRATGTAAARATDKLLGNGSRAYVIRCTGPTLRKCGHRGCSSVASHVLVAGGVKQVFCCAQCAAVGVKAVKK